MTDLISRVKKALELPEAKTCIDQRQKWIVLGETKEYERTAKLVDALVKFVRFSEQKEYRHPDEILALNKLKVALEEMERKDVLDETIEAVKRIDKQKARNKDNI